MEKFNLDTWLRDKRKVVTRDGRAARIICWDAKNSRPIVALVLTRSISQRQFDEIAINYFDDGTYFGGAKDDFLDLFFSDDEEKLTEFEQEMKDVFIEKACDAYCKVCGHYAHGVPPHICRHDCRYFSDFKNYIKKEKI